MSFFFNVENIDDVKEKSLMILVNPDLLKTFCKVAQILFLIFLLQSVPFSI